MKRCFFIFLLSLFSGLLSIDQCFSQNAKVDSLLSVLNSSKPDTSKVSVLNALAFELRSSDPAKSIEYSEMSIKLASEIGFEKGGAVALINLAFTQINIGEYDLAIANATKGLNQLKTHNDKYNEGRAYNTIGEAYRYKDNYNEALQYYQIALKIRTESKDKKGIASVLNNIGIVQYNLGNYPEALKKHFEALKIREEIADLQAVAASYNNIALIYMKQLDFSAALKINTQALEIRKKLEDKRGVATSYTNIANIQRLINETQKSLENYGFALKIFEELKDKKNIAGSYNNIGSIYQIEADTLLTKNNSAEAIKKINDAIGCFDIAKKLYDEIESNSGIILINQNLGNAYRSLKDYSRARKYYQAGLELSIKIKSKEEIKNFYSDLAITDNLTGNYKSAFENHKLYILYRDSLDNEETRKKTIQAQMTYDFEKKEAVATAEHKKELEKQELVANEKSRKQTIVIAFVVCGLLLVIVFAGFIFRSLRVTRKQKDIIEEQKNIVEVQKLEVEQQKRIVEEHQKSIIDSITYARRIQSSLLPTEKYIDKNFKRLMKN